MEASDNNIVRLAPERWACDYLISARLCIAPKGISGQTPPDKYQAKVISS